MNRNVSIVIILLVLVVIAGYLVWLRSKVESSVSPQVEQEVQVTPEATIVSIASPSATPEEKVATGTAKPRTATPGATRR